MSRPIASAARRRTRALAAIVATAALAFGFAAPAGAADSPIEIILAKTNAHRASKGLGPIHLNASMNSVATTWSKTMLSQRKLYHNGSYSSQIPSGWSRAGENVGYACGFGGANANATVIMKAWIKSAGHEANLRGDFTDIGIGFAYSSSSDCAYATQDFAKYSGSPSTFSIVGTVSPASGKSISSLSGSTVVATGGGVTKSATVSSVTGGYVLTGLPKGTYTVRIKSGTSAMTSEYLKDAASSKCATTVTIKNKDLVGIDAKLGTGSIAGPSSEIELCDVTANSTSSRYSKFAEEIGWLADEGITTGYSNGRGAYNFRPTSTVTRDAMAAFLYRHAGEPSVSGATADFDDISGSAFTTEIAWLASTGITTGWESGDGLDYRPTSAVTRDAMAAFLYRYAGEPEYTPPTSSPFADVSPDQPFYKEICWLRTTGVTAGWEVNGRMEFRPYAKITRDAMTAFLYRFESNGL